MSIFKKAFTRIVIERRLPWRVEQWISRQPMVIRRRNAKRQQQELRLFRNFFKPNDLVFDIGANIGEKAQTFLSLGAKVVCLEPDVRSLELLNQKFANHDDVSIVDAGVGSEPGKATFFPSPSSTRSTFDTSRMQQLGDDCKWDEGKTVQMTTLDALIKQFGTPQFCKIDVEGFEPEVIAGLSSAISNMCFEFHGELMDELRVCLDRLDSLGMTRFNVLLYPTGGRRPFHPLDQLYLPKHVTKEELLSTFESLSGEILSGDIYAFSS